MDKELRVVGWLAVGYPGFFLAIHIIAVVLEVYHA